MSPPSGPVVADFEGTLNVTTLTCNVTDPYINQMEITEWSVQNFRTSGLQGIMINLAPESFVITGNEISDFIFNNILVICNLSSKLDGVIIYCGTGQNPREANFTLRIYRRYQNLIDYAIICMVRII